MSIVWYWSSPGPLPILSIFTVSYSGSTETKFIWLTAKAFCGCVNIGGKNLFECHWCNSVLHLYSVSKAWQEVLLFLFQCVSFPQSIHRCLFLNNTRNSRGILWNITASAQFHTLASQLTRETEVQSMRKNLESAGCRIIESNHGSTLGILKLKWGT